MRKPAPPMKGYKKGTPERPSTKPDRVPLAITNPNKKWVLKELDSLYQEWESWKLKIEQIVDQPYNKQTQTEVFADGEEMMEAYEILQEKTLTFLDNNIQGHGFIYGRDGDHIDRNDCRLKIRHGHRMRDLNILKESLKYAHVPESYWKEKAKELVDKVVDTAGEKGTEAAIDIATGYLKNPSE